MCLDIGFGLRSVSGRFSSSGSAVKGKAKSTYEYDGSHADGNVASGCRHGRTRTYDKKDRLQFLGTYVGGRAEGPAWIFPPDWKHSGVVAVNFAAGEVVEDIAALVHPDFETAIVGKMVNGSHIVDARKGTITKLGEYRFGAQCKTE